MNLGSWRETQRGSNLIDINLTTVKHIRNSVDCLQHPQVDAPADALELMLFAGWIKILKCLNGVISCFLLHVGRH